MSNSPSACHLQNDPLIIRLLDSIDRLNPDKLASLWQSVGDQGVTLEEMIIRNGIATESQIAKTYADHYLVPLFDPPSDAPPPIDTSVSSVLPSQMCRDHLIAPLSDNGGVLEIAVFSPDSLLLADEIKLLTGRQMRPLFAPLSVIERLLQMLYEDGGSKSSDSLPSSPIFESIDDDDELETTFTATANERIHLGQTSPTGPDGQIIRYVNDVLHQAIVVGASDIHLEPYEKDCRVRFRIDGVLSELQPPPLHQWGLVIRRLKVLSKMDMAESQLPQQGTIAVRCGSIKVDLRASTCPTLFGEKLVMRVLNKNHLPEDLSALGLDPRQYRDLSESIHRKHGLVLVTGPSDSGKSSTLYACLNALNDNKTNLCAVEDPVDYKFAGINQIQTGGSTELTYAGALRVFRRQDADVIMVGEIPDDPTADACVRAAMAGHLVLSTLHTSDAFSSITQLQEMGIDPFQLASTLRLLVAQRLIRRLCEDCKMPYPLTAEASRRFQIPREVPVFRARGCKRCRNTGYKGRIAVFEVIRINQRLMSLIQARESIDAMKRAAVEDGMNLIAQSVAIKIADGLTSIEEASTLLD